MDSPYGEANRPPGTDSVVVNRGIGWVGWKYRSGWVEWEFDWNAFAAWYEAENFKEPGRIYNGSGQLIYRGVVMNYKEPIPSIRLKAQRRGLQDYEYFWLLTQKLGNREKSDAFVNSMIYKRPFGVSAMRDIEVWKNNPDDWAVLLFTSQFNSTRCAAADILRAL